MDVANYLSELLGEFGEVNVPGLGYFMQLRLDGYYDNEASTFYPPRHTVQFDPQSIDDDVFYRYIAEKKKISLASSKYFTEKYISNLKEEAMSNDVVLADLGSLYSDGSKLSFKAVEAMANDPAFYGYPQIKQNKLGGTSVVAQLESMRPPARPFPAPVKSPESSPNSETATVQTDLYTSPAGHYASPDETEDQEEFVFKGKTYVDEEEAEGTNYLRLLIVFLIVVMVGALMVFGLYKFKPALFDHFKTPKIAPIVLKAPVQPDTGKTAAPVTTDTVKKASTVIKPTVIKPTVVKADTVKKQTTTNNVATAQSSTVIDSSKTRYEIVGTSCKTITEANHRIENYKSENIDAHILNAPGIGKLIKISIGTYFNRAEAITAREDLIKSGKVKSDIYIKEINPKQ